MALRQEFLSEESEAEIRAAGGEGSSGVDPITEIASLAQLSQATQEIETAVHPSLEEIDQALLKKLGHTDENLQMYGCFVEELSERLAASELTGDPLQDQIDIYLRHLLSAHAAAIRFRAHLQAEQGVALNTIIPIANQILWGVIGILGRAGWYDSLKLGTDEASDTIIEVVLAGLHARPEYQSSESTSPHTASTISKPGQTGSYPLSDPTPTAPRRSRATRSPDRRERQADPWADDLVRVYLRDIGRHPLLTKEDEVKLAQAIQAGETARIRLVSGGRISREQRSQLEKTVKEGKKAQEAFVNSNLRLVVSIAKRYRSSGLPLLDLVQEGNLGLMHAVEKFEWQKGFKFSTYATWWIKQAITRAIANTGRTVRLPVHAIDKLNLLQTVRREIQEEGREPTVEVLAEAMELPVKTITKLLAWQSDVISIHNTVGSGGSGVFDRPTELEELTADPDSAVAFDELVDSIVLGEGASLLLSLASNDEEREILRLRFGLDNGGAGMILDDVGKRLGVTRERARQIQAKIIEKIVAQARMQGIDKSAFS